jgi:LysR family transcriptional activator of nhaA
VRLRVGVADVVPKLVAELLLRRAMASEEAIRLVVREDHADDLELMLGAYHLDVVIADAPLSPRVKVKAFSHRLATCGVSLFGTAALARRLGEGFPGSLAGAPVLLPGDETAVRREIDRWLEEREIRPEVVGEFDDSALMKVFGQRGTGVFPAPDLIADEVCRQYGVRRLGPLEGVEESFWAITLERRIGHPAVVALVEGETAG